jgi:hypothetical protein
MKNLIKEINKIRLASKNKWYYINFSCGETLYRMKAYETWIQILEINNSMRISSPANLNVTGFKKFIEDAILEYSANGDTFTIVQIKGV